MSIGCGGSGGSGATAGGSGGGGGGGSTGRANIFITDNLSDNYDAVWVTIKKVELVSAAGNRTVFESATGETVNLKSLRDSNGAKFRFLSAENVPFGTYTGVRVTVDRDLVLYPSGATAGQAREFASAQGEDASFNVNLSSPQNLSVSGDDFILDFDLSQWTDDGTKVTAVVVEGDDDSLTTGERHSESEIRGTIKGIAGTAPDLTLSIDLATGGTIEVKTTANTDLSTDDVAEALAVGKFVEIHGIYDPNTRRLIASQIELEDNDNHADEPRVEGAPSTINEAEGKFMVTAAEIRGFLPGNKAIKVETTGTTIFLANSGLPITRAEFFAALPTAPSVEVEGTFNAETTTLTARKVKLDDEGPNRVEIRGAASELNGAQGTFKVAASSFGGLLIPAGSLVTVSVTDQTSFLGDNNQTLTKEQFFAAAGNAAVVEVEGTFNAGQSQIVAKKVKIEDDANANEVEVEGVSSDGDANAGKFKVAAHEWEGALFVNGQSIPVELLPNAELKDGDNTITKEALFAQIATGARVDVRGSLQGGVLKADRVRIKHED